MLNFKNKIPHLINNECKLFIALIKLKKFNFLILFFIFLEYFNTDISLKDFKES